MIFDYLQIAFVFQEWYLKESPYTLSILVNGRHEILECIMESHQILMDFSYPIALLGLQLLISPFIINSRRNYKEGISSDQYAMYRSVQGIFMLMRKSFVNILRPIRQK